MSIDAKLIDQIVVEVLSQLRQRIDSAPSSSTANAPSELELAPASAAIKDSNHSVDLPEAVITEETLKQRAKPGVALRMNAGAILTPSARDYVKSQGISLSRNGQNGQVGQAGSHNVGTIIAGHLPEVVQSFLADVKRQSKPSWTVEMESGAAQVADRVRSVICRGESRQTLVFVKNPHLLACLVNRNPNCRAAVVQSGADVRRVRSEFGANVLCVDLQQPTFMGLREILRSCGQTVDLIQEPEELKRSP